jgi:hypothetical protein
MLLLHLSVWSGPGRHSATEWSPIDRQEAWSSEAATLTEALALLEQYRRLFRDTYNPDGKGTALQFRLLGVQVIERLDQATADAVEVHSIERRLAALQEEAAERLRVESEAAR